MKTLEVIEPLTSAEETEYQSSKFEIATAQKHVERWVKAAMKIREGRLYRIEFGTWEKFCEQILLKTARSVHMAIEAEQVRAEIGSTASDLSDRAALALKEVEPKKRKAIVAKAAKSGEPATPKSIRKAAGLPALAPAPERDYSGAYSSAPAAAPTPAEAFGGDEPEVDAELPEVVDAASAARRLELVYERDKAWFNAVPQPLPRMILDRLIGGLNK